MENELKPCPFCGGEADIDEIAGNPDTNEPYAWGVGCKKCNIGWYEETKEKAIAMWNRRPAPENKALTCEGCTHDNLNGKDYPCVRCQRRYGDYYKAHKPEEDAG